jgi:long-chain acyl-CoA synthetase
LKQSAPLYIQRAENRDTSQEEREQLLRLNTASIGATSGTTATAKGIILSHDSLWERARRESEVFSISRDDSILYLLSMTYSMASPIAAALLTGATIVIADGMDLQALPQLVAQYGVTLVYASPLVYRMILNEGEAAIGCLRSVRCLISTGNALPNTTAEEFSAKVGREIVQRYGLNECGPVLANLSNEVSMRGSVGIPARVEVELASEDGTLLAGEATGELLVRGLGLFEGYYRPWRLRDEVLEHGWFKTGDLATRDQAGYYWIVGRTKDMINVGGVKVFPLEIEEVLLTHPEVDEALVFGAAEPRFGEVPHAQVKLVAGSDLSAKELLRYVNQRLSVFKSLRLIELVDHLPKTVTGKVRRPTPS